MVMITNSFDKFPKQPTGLMYEQFGKIGLNPATPTVSDDFSNGQGNWGVSGSGGTLTFTNEINQASSGSGDMKMPYLDLQNSSYLGSGNYASETKWVLRWKQTWSNAPDNYGTPFMLLSSTTGVQSASQNYIGIRFDGSAITAGGATSSTVDGASSSTGVSTSYTTTTYYMEMVRDGSNMYVRNYTSSAYDTIAQESSAISIGSGTYNLRYIKMIPRWDTGSGSFDTTWDDIEFYNNVSSLAGSLKVKQHFIDWFSGKQASSHWALTHPSGSGGTFVGKDEVNGGMIFTSGTSGNNNCVWWFNNKRQYNPTGFIQIAVWRNDPTSSGHSYNQTIVGMSNASDNGQYTYWQFNGATAYFRIRNRGSGSAGALIDSSVTKDQVFHKFKIEGKSASLEYSIDDALEITRTSELPSVALQPIIKGDNSGQNPLVGAIRYMEIYNT